MLDRYKLRLAMNPELEDPSLPELPASIDLCFLVVAQVFQQSQKLPALWDG
jgi:hypothetical protein